MNITKIVRISFPESYGRLPVVQFITDLPSIRPHFKNLSFTIDNISMDYLKEHFPNIEIEEIKIGNED